MSRFHLPGAWLGIVCLVLAYALPEVSPAAGLSTTMLVGSETSAKAVVKVLSVDVAKGLLAVRDREGQTLELTVDARSILRRAGKIIPLKEVNVGERIMVYYVNMAGNRRLAKYVSLMPGRRAPMAKPAPGNRE